MSNTQKLSTSQVILRNRIQKIRTEVSEASELLNCHTFITRAKNMRFSDGADIQSAFSVAMEEGLIIGVPWEGKEQYPAVQIDPHTLDVYTALPGLIRDAHDKGCDSWDLLEWLMSEHYIPSGEHEGLGEAADFESLEELNESVDSEPACFIESSKAIDLLREGRIEDFTRLKDLWLYK